MTRRKGIGAGAAVAALIVAGLALGMVSGNLSIGGPGQDEGEMVNVNEFGIDGKVSFPTTPSSATVTLYKAEPENFGNYADWDASSAKSGLEAGVDYHEKTSVSSDSVTFDDLESGTYYMVVEDSNFNDAFVTVEQPEQVSAIKADNDKPVVLARGSDISTSASYGSDNVVSYDDEGNVLTTGTDLPDPSNETATFEITRSIDVDTGVALVSNLETTSFNDGDGIEDVTVTVTADGSQVYSKELKSGSSGELADSTSFGEDLREDVDTNPVRSSDEIEVTYEVTAQMNDQSSSAGDGVLQGGESILTTGVDDVTGSDISTATKAYTR